MAEDNKRTVEGLSDQDLQRISGLGHGTRNLDVLTDSDIRGLVAVADHTDEVIGALDIATARGLEAIGIEAESDAAAICPVDTGRLRNSITHTIESDGKTAVIGTNVEYAIFVHNGTHRQKAQPFLTNAATTNAGKYRGILEAAFGGR